MRIGIVVPPFISVPPERYGGTELFVAQLAEGLQARGHHPIVYTVGSSRVRCETRWRVPHGRWPIESALESSLEDLDHSSWACSDAAQTCDVLHINNAPGLHISRFVNRPFVYTMHHPHDAALSNYYAGLPAIRYVAISHNQAQRERLPQLSVVHHGLDHRRYRVATGRRDYLCFIGRLAPIKGTHIAIQVARRAGLPLKIAGEIQPLFQEYWKQEIEPQLGHGIEYVGEVDLKGKNELLAGARALLFPIQWEEPFGLVMVEAMACGVPVLAFGRGSAPEVVEDGTSGWLCRDMEDMADRCVSLDISPVQCREYLERRFSLAGMVDGYLAVYQRALQAAAESETSSLQFAS
ncbi:MAG TPA: glycosyltransferase family 4 protein [Terriglobales bacterium]|jgi:glycosyltransferase involved in cell wall biosynthesis